MTTWYSMSRWSEKPGAKEFTRETESYLFYTGWGGKEARAAIAKARGEQ